jgi:hypothetical protein
MGVCVMNHNNLYSLKDIELLKNKLDTYKQILESVKEGEVVNDYLFTKKENQEIKRQVKNLEGVITNIKETQTSQLSQYAEQNKKSSDQLQDANDFLKHLHQELTDLKNTINLRNVTQLDDKLNTLIELQQTLISASEDNNKVNIKKEETEHRVNNLSYQNSNLQPSSYQKIQNLLQTANQMHFPSVQKKTFTGPDDVNVNQLNHHINQNFPQNIPSTSGINNNKNSMFSNSLPGHGVGTSKINPMRRNAKPVKNQNPFDIFKNNMNKVAINNSKIPNLQNNIQEDTDQTQDTKGKLKQQTRIEKEQSDQTQD